MPYHSSLRYQISPKAQAIKKEKKNKKKTCSTYKGHFIHLTVPLISHDRFHVNRRECNMKSPLDCSRTKQAHCLSFAIFLEDLEFAVCSSHGNHKYHIIVWLGLRAKQPPDLGERQRKNHVCQNSLFQSWPHVVNLLLLFFWHKRISLKSK